MDVGVWSWLAANGPGISATAASLSSAAAILALWSGARDVEAKSRPMIVAEFCKAQDSRGTIDLVVRNAGPSIARDLRVTFDPPILIPDGEDAKRLMTPLLIRRYASRILTLGPGQELRNIWFAGEARGTGELVNSEPTPDRVTVALSYRGRRRRGYHDSFELDVDIVRMTTFSVSSESFPGRVKAIATALTKLSESTAQIARETRAGRAIDDPDL